MPVICTGRKLKRKNHKRDRFVAVARQIAPIIEQARTAGKHGTREIADYVNAAGECNWTGMPFGFDSMFRVLRMLERLGLAEGPRSVSQALAARPYKPRRPQRPQRSSSSGFPLISGVDATALSKAQSKK